MQNWNIGPNLGQFGGRPESSWDFEENTIDSIRRPSELVINTEENSFVLQPGNPVGFTGNISRYKINDGFLIGQFNTNTAPNVDSFATFHNGSVGPTPDDGYAHAVFADGSVQAVDPIGNRTGPFTVMNPYTNKSESMSRTVMWCSDDIPNED